jgi:hypothetical protein
VFESHRPDHKNQWVTVFSVAFFYFVVSYALQEPPFRQPSTLILSNSGRVYVYIYPTLTMAKAFSKTFGIDPALMEKNGVFDPIMGIDTRLFIDPFLLAKSSAPELAASFQRLQQHFTDVLMLLNACEKEQDVFWKRAKALLLSPEVHGLSIGYSEGEGGSGTGTILTERLLNTAFQIVKKGTINPRLFELVGLFEQDFGPDRISDMTAKIIAADLYAYTTRVCEEMGVETREFDFKGIDTSAFLPVNPATNKPIILVPRDVLRDLPIALGWTDVNTIASENAELRQKVNSIVGDTWREATLRLQKDTLKEMLIGNPELIQDLLAQYIKKTPQLYDYENDPSGEANWLKASETLTNKNPLPLNLSATPSIDEVFAVVHMICLKFKELVESNQLAHLLYDSNGERKHERAAQLLFYGVADLYCEANNIMIAREPNAGRGPVDFKFGVGYSNSVLVEMKLSANKTLQNGYDVQLPIYQQAEKTKRGIFLVIENGGITESRKQHFFEHVRANQGNDPLVIWVDGLLKASASVAETN